MFIFTCFKILFPINITQLKKGNIHLEERGCPFLVGDQFVEVVVV